MTGQDELPWDPAYVAACEAVIAAKAQRDVAVAAWRDAVRRRNAYLHAGGVLPAEATSA
jgi:hypothetical protein